MNEVTWGALALALTVLGSSYTWWAFRNRGAAAGTRGAGLTLLPAAAWLTGTLEMFTEIAGSVADWATHLVLSPLVWAGVVLAGLSVLLLGVSGFLRSRTTPAATNARTGDAALPPGRPARREPVLDDDLADIEAMLKRRGIE